MNSCGTAALGCEIADLIGKPFREHARGPDAYDCVGLLIKVQRRLGNKVPDYFSDPSRLEHEIVCWEKVTSPEPGDGVLLRSFRPRFHIGIVVDESSMIHADPHAGVCIVRIDSPLWKNRIEGFYRWMS